MSEADPHVYLHQVAVRMRDPEVRRTLESASGGTLTVSSVEKKQRKRNPIFFSTTKNLNFFV